MSWRLVPINLYIYVKVVVDRLSILIFLMRTAIILCVTATVWRTFATHFDSVASGYCRSIIVHRCRSTAHSGTVPVRSRTLSAVSAVTCSVVAAVPDCACSDAADDAVPAAVAGPDAVSRSANGAVPLVTAR